MNTLHDRRDRFLPPSRRRSRSGFTLLEVLVSMGIIVAALAGIAALLPATGSRLAEATETDRAGTMAANAQAELANRGLVTAALWMGSGTTRLVPAPAVVFGEGLPRLTTFASATSSVGSALLTEVNRRIHPDSFRLPDAVVTSPNGSQPGICYGCMLTSLAQPAAGVPVQATTVVFRKPNPEVQEFTLTQTGSGSTVFTGNSGAGAEAARKRFLAGCAWVLAVRSGTAPLWLPIASSWTTYLPGATSGNPTGTVYVSLAGTDVRGYVSGSTLQVFGFDGLLRVDTRTINLE